MVLSLKVVADDLQSDGVKQSSIVFLRGFDDDATGKGPHGWDHRFFYGLWVMGDG